MNYEEKLSCIDSAEAGLYDLIEKTDDPADLEKVIEVAMKLDFLRHNLRDNLMPIPIGHTVLETPPEAEEIPGQVEITEAPVKETKADETADPEPALSKEEVKTELAALKNQHDKLDLAGLMKSLGFSKLSDVPATQYRELLAAAHKAVEELG